MATLNIEVPDQTFFDILTTAVESGIAYWANDYGYSFDIERRDDLCVTKVTIHGPKSEEGQAPAHRTITPERLAAALSKHGMRYSHILDTVIIGDVDGPTADAELLGIDVLDHVIVTDGTAFVSFKERGLL